MADAPLLVLYLYVAICCGIAGYRYQGLTGFIGGLILGPLGVLACWADFRRTEEGREGEGKSKRYPYA